MGCNNTRIKDDDLNKPFDPLTMGAGIVDEEDRKRKIQEDEERRRRMQEEEDEEEDEYKGLTEEEKRKKMYINEYLRKKQLENNYIRQRATNIDVDIEGIYNMRIIEHNNDILLNQAIEDEKNKWAEVSKLHKTTQVIKRLKAKGIEENQKSKVLKLLLIGEGNSGKTSIAHQFAFDKCPDQYNIIFPQAQIFEEKYYHIKITDTPNFEDYIDHMENDLYDADMVIFVFDVSKKRALQRLQEIIKQIDFYEDQKWAIVANKIDLCPEYEKFHLHELEKISIDFGMKYTITSIKRSPNDIRKLFMELFQEAYPLSLQYDNKDK